MKKRAYILLVMLLLLMNVSEAYAFTGVGLADKPYSISEVSKTLPTDEEYKNLTYSAWQEEGVFEKLYQNGYYILRVQDKLGNISYKAIKIEGLTEKFAVKYVDKSDDGIILHEEERFVKFGNSVAGSDLGAEAALGKYYPGYFYESCTNTIVSPYDENIVTRTFKAKVSKVVFHSANGNTFTSEEVKYGQGAKTDTYPEKESIYNDSHTVKYNFVGWTAENGTLVDIGNITQDLNLYPKYEEEIIPNEITIAFHINDTNNTVRYVTGRRGEIEAPEPMKESVETESGNIWYSFEYWTLYDKTKVFDINSFTHNTDLYAVYSENFNAKYEPPKLEEALLEKVEAEELLVETPKGEDAEEIKIIHHMDIEDNPVAKGFSSINQILMDNKEVVGTVAALGLITAFLTTLLYTTMGFGIIQTTIFLHALIKKKKRYTEGVWFINRTDMKYVDKYGKPITVKREEKIKFLNKKGKELYAVDVNEQLGKLNACRINKKEFIRKIKESEVYTVFNADVRIEFNNVEHSNKALGFNLLANIKNVSSNASHYTMKVINGGKELMYELKADVNTI